MTLINENEQKPAIDSSDKLRVSFDQVMKFCVGEDDPRQYMRQPAINDGFVVATNGHVILRVPVGQFDGVEHLPSDSKLSTLGVHHFFDQSFLPDPVRLILPEPVICPECGGKGSVFALERAVKQGLLCKDIAGWHSGVEMTPPVIGHDWRDAEGKLLHRVTMHAPDDFDEQYFHDLLTVPDEVWRDLALWDGCEECSGVGVRHVGIDETDSMTSMFAEVGGYPVAMPYLASVVSVLGDEVRISDTPAPGEEFMTMPVLFERGGVTIALQAVFTHRINRKWDAIAGKLLERCDVPGLFEGPEELAWQEVAA